MDNINIKITAFGNQPITRPLRVTTTNLAVTGGTPLIKDHLHAAQAFLII
jgi:hypothetical protein